MNIIHGMNNKTLPRYAAAALKHRLSVMPAVVVTGARQTGKTTLAKMLDKGRSYYSLDDMDVFDLARRNPEGLVEGDLNIGRRYDGTLKAVTGCSFSYTDLASGRSSIREARADCRAGRVKSHEKVFGEWSFGLSTLSVASGTSRALLSLI